MGFSRVKRLTILQENFGSSAWIGLHRGATAPDSRDNSGFSEPDTTQEPRYERFEMYSTEPTQPGESEAQRQAHYYYEASGGNPGGVRIRNTKTLYWGPFSQSYTITHIGFFSQAAKTANEAPPYYVAKLTDEQGVAAPVTVQAGDVLVMQKEYSDGVDTHLANLRVMMPDDND